MVPVMVNTYYPPNQPTPKRCYAFGQAVRKAVESWNSDKRVALIASGGLSHVVIDEEIDAMVIDGLKNKKPEVLFQLPRNCTFVSARRMPACSLVKKLAPVV